MQDLCGSTVSTDRRRGHDWATNLVHPDTKRKVAYSCPKCSWGDRMHRDEREEDYLRDNPHPRWYPKRCKSCTRLKYGREVSNRIAKLIDDDKQHCLITFTLPDKVTNSREGMDRLKVGIKKLTRTANWNNLFDGWVYCYEEVIQQGLRLKDPNKDSYGPDDIVEYWEAHAHIHMIARRIGKVARITPTELDKLKADAVTNGFGKVVHIAPVKRTGAYKKKTTRYLAKYIAKRQGNRHKSGTRMMETGGVFRNKKG